MTKPWIAHCFVERAIDLVDSVQPYKYSSLLLTTPLALHKLSQVRVANPVERTIRDFVLDPVEELLRADWPRQQDRRPAFHYKGKVFR